VRAVGGLNAPTAESALSQINAGRLVLQLVVALVAFFLVLAILAQVYREPLLAAAAWFVSTLGGLGVSLAFFFTDALPIPIPPDPVFAVAILGGMNAVTAAAWGVAGSLIGGATGYFIGRRLAHTRLFARLLAGRSRAAYEAVEKYGALGLAITALTPIPYWAGAWAAGALGMPLGRFALVSLLRIPRIAGYVALMYFGVMTFAG
jgi:membrane protein YqaA with SNARE-associated domain